MSEKVISIISSVISTHELVVFVVSMLPVVELRGAIPLGVFSYNFSLIKALLLSLSGNLLIVFPLVFLMDFIERQFKRVDFLDKLLQKIFSRARSKAEKIRRYELLGLFLFVAIPLPGTGAWTGALVAYLLGMDKWSALLSISMGVIVAGLLVSLFTAFGIVKGLLIGAFTLFVLDRVFSLVLDRIYKVD
ncbi:MAG: small multi-drug export protein [candidate division WOR-3 bacterium]